MDCTYAEGLERCVVMAQAAMSVKNIAIDTLASELEALRKENEVLVGMTGGAEVKGLRQALQQANLQVEQLSHQVHEELELRSELERELEETSAAAQVLMETVRELYSEPADSQPPDSPISDNNEAWDTPPAAMSPAASPLRQHGLLGSSAAASSLASVPATAAAAAAVAESPPAAAARVGGADSAGVADNPALNGILTPLENKMQSLTNKLMGLVSWLDAKETPATPREYPVTAAPNNISPAARSTNNSAHRLRLGSCSRSPSPMSFLNSPAAAVTRLAGSSRGNNGKVHSSSNSASPQPLTCLASFISQGQQLQLDGAIGSSKSSSYLSGDPGAFNFAAGFNPRMQSRNAAGQRASKATNAALLHSNADVPKVQQVPAGNADGKVISKAGSASGAMDQIADSSNSSFKSSEPAAEQAADISGVRDATSSSNGSPGLVIV